MDRERSHLEELLVAGFGRRWHAMGAQDAYADGSDLKTGLPHSDLRVRPGAKSQCGQSVLRLLSLLLSSCFLINMLLSAPRTMYLPGPVL